MPVIKPLEHRRQGPVGPRDRPYRVPVIPRATHDRPGPTRMEMNPLTQRETPVSDVEGEEKLLALEHVLVMQV